MQRLRCPKRPGWEQIIGDQGIPYWPTKLPDGSVVSYWNEGVYYSFTPEEIDTIERDSETLFNMFLAAGDAMAADREFMLRMGIPEWAIDAVVKSWHRDPARWICGRMDVRYAGNSHLSAADPTFNRIKFYELNGQTPTALPEAAVIQWYWHQQTGVGDDQWNMLDARLVKGWERIGADISERLGRLPVVYFAYTNAEESGEDEMNVRYMMDTAERAGLATKLICVEDIVWDVNTDKFYDPGGNHIDAIWFLYPWEWALNEKFGKAAVRSTMAGDGQGTVWINDIFTMLWSNKALNVMLTRLYGDKPEGELLLKTYFSDERPPWMRNYVEKPLLAREGANVRIFVDGKLVFETGGDYDGPTVVQELAELPNFPGIDSDDTPDNHPVIGVWFVTGEEDEPAAVSLVIRESDGLVTDNTSRCVPHAIEEDATEKAA